MTTLPEWPGVPTFAYGQVMSANLHLNRLQEATRYLLAMLQAPRNVFVGVRRAGWVSSYTTIWTGAIRHKADRLRVCWRNSGGDTFQVRVRYNETTVYESDWITDAGETQHDETVDISGLGLVSGDFYVVTFDVRRNTGTCEGCWLWLLDLAETAAASLPTLPDCNDEDVLTAAQWNALAQYAEALRQAGSGPQAGYPSVRSKLTTVYEMVRGGIRHVSNALIYQVWRKQYNPGYDFELDIVVDGTTLIHLNDASSPVYTLENSGKPFPRADLYYPYTGTLDLSGLGLTPGQVYRVYVWGDDPDSVYEHDRGLVDYLYEAADASAPTGWTAMSEWAHGDYVRGSTGSSQVKAIRDNLEWLGARLAYYNPACRHWYAPNDDFPLGFWFVHRHRFLHYYSESEKSPRLRYYADGWQEVSLPATASDAWRVYDLAQLELLTTGRRYVVQGCEYAIEDGDA